MSVFTNIFTTPATQRKLCYQGETDPDGNWTNGVLRTEEGDEMYPVEDGIPRFHFGQGHGWDDEELREEQFRKGGVDPDKLIERNYDYMVNQWPAYDQYKEWIAKIAATEGPIVELAVGPGGGLSPIILDMNPGANLTMTDIGLWPLRQWQKFARGRDWPNLRFAQLDATKIPIASDSVAAVVSWGGISNIGPRHEAVKESYRILRPGGTLYALELLPDHEITPRCPPEMIAKLREFYPELETGYRPVFEGAGFDPVRIRPMGKRPLVPGEGGLADFCEKYEVVMHLRFWRIRAVKPG